MTSVKNRPLPGDIILYPITAASEWSSKIVGLAEMVCGQWRDGRQYSHAAILAQSPGMQYEESWPTSGLHRMDPKRPYEIWRVEGVEEDERQRILRWCAVHDGEWYDLGCLFTFGLLQSRHRAVCSQYVARAYMAGAGIRFGKEGHRIVSPDALADYKLAWRVI